MSSPGNNIPHAVNARALSLGDIRLVDEDGNLLTDRTQLAYLPVSARIDVEVDIGVQIEGVYNAVTNPNPDNVGLVVSTNVAAPGDPQQTVRTTGGVSSTTIISARFHGLDTRSKLYGKSGANEQELHAIALDGTDFGLGVGVYDEALAAQKAAAVAGDSVRTASNLYGERVIAGHTWATNSNRVEEINPLDQRYVGPETLVAAGQDFTAAWADLGVEIPCAGYTKLGIWVTLDINDSENMRIKALAKHTSGGAEEYNLPIESAAPDKITIQDEYYEFADDSDQLVLLTIELDNLVPYVQLQIQAGVVGADEGQVDACYVTKSWV